jgi:hypothetical protein
MPRVRRHTPRPKFRHSLGAAVALLGYLAAAIGFPLPAAPAVRKDLSQPFPCQDHLCGCQNAEQCWSSCCCFTPAERFARAESHGVRPPAYAEKPAADGWRTVPLREKSGDDAAPTTCCGDGTPDRSCCPKCRSASRASCCEREAQEQPLAAPGLAEAGRGVRWAMLVSALRCRGLTTLWVASGAVVVPPPAIPSASGSLAPERLRPKDFFATRLTRTPPAPPPRQFTV